MRYKNEIKEKAYCPVCKKITDFVFEVEIIYASWYEDDDVRGIAVCQECFSTFDKDDIEVDYE